MRATSRSVFRAPPRRKPKAGPGARRTNYRAVKVRAYCRRGRGESTWQKSARHAAEMGW